ncbi:unnamed protein product, partial [Pylaiella littoralis]
AAALIVRTPGTTTSGSEQSRAADLVLRALRPLEIDWCPFLPSALLLCYYCCKYQNAKILARSRIHLQSIVTTVIKRCIEKQHEMPSYTYTRPSLLTSPHTRHL